MPDFTIFDKYIDLYDKQVGAPKILVIDLWDQTMNPPAKEPNGKPKLNYIVNNNGKYEPVNGPFYGDPGSEKIWQAVFDGIKASLKKQKWDNTIMILGEANDSRPSAELGQFFDKISPGICWNVFTHGRGDPSFKEGQIREIAGVRYYLYEHPAGKAGHNPPAVAVVHKNIDPKVSVIATSTRHNWVQSDTAPYMYRALPDVAMGSEALGVTRYGLDYWGGEYMFTGWFNLWRNNTSAMIAPGPTGPVSTVRFEAFIEGIQELEARLVIEDAITAKKLDAALLKKAGDLLIQRRTIRLAGRPSWPAGPNWQELTKQLFDVAGEIEKANAAAKGVK